MSFEEINLYDEAPLNQVERRVEERKKPKRDAEFVIQKDWGHLAQIALNDNNIILGEIIDISRTGVGCKVAYQFDILNPIPVYVTFAFKNQRSSINSFETMKIPALIVRSAELEGMFCEIGIKFLSLSSIPAQKLAWLIKEIT